MEQQMKKSYLEFYMNCMEAGHMPEFGLCGSLWTNKEDGLLELFKPTLEDRATYNIETDYWGIEIEGRYATDEEAEDRKWTTLRQTIVLFLACLNNEL